MSPRTDVQNRKSAPSRERSSSIGARAIRMRGYAATSVDAIAERPASRRGCCITTSTARPRAQRLVVEPFSEYRFSRSTHGDGRPARLDRPEYPLPSHAVALTDGRITWTRGGEALLFVHGTPTWSFEYRHLIAALSKRYRCIAPDHLGFGQSSRPPGVRLHARSARRRVAGVRRAPRPRSDSPWSFTTSAVRSACRWPWRGSSEPASARRDHHEHLGVAARRRSEDGARRAGSSAARSGDCCIATRTRRCG